MLLDSPPTQQLSTPSIPVTPFEKNNTFSRQPLSLTHQPNFAQTSIIHSLSYRAQRYLKCYPLHWNRRNFNYGIPHLQRDMDYPSHPQQNLNCPPSKLNPPPTLLQGNLNAPPTPPTPPQRNVKGHTSSLITSSAHWITFPPHLNDLPYHLNVPNYPLHRSPNWNPSLSHLSCHSLKQEASNIIDVSLPKLMQAKVIKPGEEKLSFYHDGSKYIGSLLPSGSNVDKGSGATCKNLSSWNTWSEPVSYEDTVPLRQIVKYYNGRLKESCSYSKRNEQNNVDTEEMFLDETHSNSPVQRIKYNNKLPEEIEICNKIDGKVNVDIEELSMIESCLSSPDSVNITLRQLIDAKLIYPGKRNLSWFHNGLMHCGSLNGKGKIIDECTKRRFSSLRSWSLYYDVAYPLTFWYNEQTRINDLKKLLISNKEYKMLPMVRSKAISLVHLIDMNLVRPGNGVLSFMYAKRKYTGTLLEDGTIKDDTTYETFSSVSTWYLKVVGQNSSGWRVFFYLDRNLLALKRIYMNHIRGVTKRKRKQKNNVREKEVCKRLKVNKNDIEFFSGKYACSGLCCNKVAGFQEIFEHEKRCKTLQMEKKCIALVKSKQALRLVKHALDMPPTAEVLNFISKGLSISNNLLTGLYETVINGKYDYSVARANTQIELMMQGLKECYLKKRFFQTFSNREVQKTF